MVFVPCMCINPQATWYQLEQQKKKYECDICGEKISGYKYCKVCPVKMCDECFDKNNGYCCEEHDPNIKEVF